MTLGAGGGLLLALSLPPWPVPAGAWGLGVSGAAVLYAALADRRAGTRLLTGLVAGLALYGPGLWWMREFSLPGYAVAVALQALILGTGLVLVPSRPGHRTWRAAGGFPAALVLVEAARASWPFGGLPLAGIDLGQLDGPLASVARLGGRLGIVAVVGAAGVGLALVLGRGQAPPVGWVTRSPAWRRVGGLAVLAGVVLAAVGGAAAPDGEVAGRSRVALVQGGGERGRRAVETDERLVFAAHLRAAGRVRPPVDLVVWPEDVVDLDELAGSPEDAELAALARRLGATVVAGVVEDSGPCPRQDGAVCRYTNAAVAWAPEAGRIDRTDKAHRVPFGEYVPYRSFFGRLGDVSAVPRDATVGRGPGVLDTPVGRLGVLISFEVFFGQRASEAVAAGGRLLLVPTNASSYREAQVPAQQVAAARLRAVETGRWVVQAAPTGYSAVIDHRGRLLLRSGLGGSAVLETSVDLRSGRTPATAVGGWPMVGGAVVLLGTAKLSGIRSGSLMVGYGRRRRSRTT